MEEAAKRDSSSSSTDIADTKHKTEEGLHMPDTKEASQTSSENVSKPGDLEKGLQEAIAPDVDPIPAPPADEDHEYPPLRKVLLIMSSVYMTFLLVALVHLPFLRPSVFLADMCRTAQSSQRRSPKSQTTFTPSAM